MLVVHGPLQLVAHGPLHSAEASASFLDVEHDSAVRRHFLCFLDAMLDAQLVMEEDMVEPDTFYVDESWRPLHAHALAEPAAACLADLRLVPLTRRIAPRPRRRVPLAWRLVPRPWRLVPSALQTGQLSTP